MSDADALRELQDRMVRGLRDMQNDPTLPERYRMLARQGLCYVIVDQAFDGDEEERLYRDDNWRRLLADVRGALGHAANDEDEISEGWRRRFARLLVRMDRLLGEPGRSPGPPRETAAPGDGITLKCATCGKTTDVPVRGDRLLVGEVARGWTFTTNEGWTCPEGHKEDPPSPPPPPRDQDPNTEVGPV